ncbi:hypothetical protein [Bradyrhizobium erythrophlei]|uniref:Uncharacterized protein n=1 Tax=Bradyrhizobium erythrophlei TaxID=1437360 RepID=A0A1M5H2W9_9BRAD|nr:hypothetical protein [Bradyrhizobium erythrophlei]SHG10369.1 hypothetical protein SAMN05443248_0296 [Bradyrhizobium erythrophlei]
MSLRTHPARLAAIAANAETFDPGVPCRAKGHVSPRNARKLYCLACDRDRERRATQAKRARAKRLAKVHAREAAEMAAMFETVRANWHARAARYGTKIPKAFQ